jgi:hypothetical protein
VRLVDLDAALTVAVDDRHYRRADPGEGMETAQGIVFLCPRCFYRNGGAVGTHMVICWFEGRGVPASVPPTGRWKAYGLCLEDLSLAPSIMIPDGCRWHGFVRDGEVSSYA